MKFLKVGRVAIITRGRYAGKKVRDPTLLPSPRFVWRESNAIRSDGIWEVWWGHDYMGAMMASNAWDTDAIGIVNTCSRQLQKADRVLSLLQFRS